MRTWSIVPSCSTAMLRMENDRVSPVPKAADVITVLSMTPTTISAVWAGRRGMLLRPSLTMMRFQLAKAATISIAGTKMASKAIMIPVMDSPNSSCIAATPIRDSALENRPFRVPPAP